MTSFTKLAPTAFAWTMRGAYLPVSLNPISHHLLFIPGRGVVVLLGEYHLGQRKHLFLGTATNVVHSLVLKNLSRPFLKDEIKLPPWHFWSLIPIMCHHCHPPIFHYVPQMTFSYTQCLPFSKYNRLVPTSKPQIMYDPC